MLPHWRNGGIIPGWIVYYAWGLKPVDEYGDSVALVRWLDGWTDGWMDAPRVRGRADGEERKGSATRRKWTNDSKSETKSIQQVSLYIFVNGFQPFAAAIQSAYIFY